ncbi:dehydrogenase/reductase SDR family member 4 isoform X2 [Nannospalax galili]|uniref:dehydrogenase/reductase SDR family member 4 isoform X2 n=1 Tax=Nannospalax galili TaxID=1026970 RepID=UPI00111C3214|nr:dehydrogenase/reductase SDR family member 4 isoform X2 [Nannospalax galili]
MQEARLLLGRGARAWKSVRMASSGVTRRNPLANKVALVTASTDGIGLAIARRLAEDGAHVVISSRKQQNVDRTVATLQGEGLSVTGIVCHVGKAEDRERLVTTAVNRHGGIDILVSNAAVNPFFGNMMDVTEDVWDKVLKINVTATAMMTKAVVPEIEKRGGGSVVIVASVAGFAPFPVRTRLPLLSCPPSHIIHPTNYPKKYFSITLASPFPQNRCLAFHELYKAVF